MNYTKIDNNKVLFRINAKIDEWKEITEISGGDIITLLNHVIDDNEFQIAEYSNDLIRNEVHNVIYKSIYSQFDEIIKNKKSILDQNNTRYREIIEKYKLA